MSAVVDLPRRHRVTVSEFLRMGTAGVFGADARLELIEGEILEMAPIGSPHAGRVNLLAAAFFAESAGRYIVSVQNPVALGERSLPQPDLALLEWRKDGYTSSHPTPDDVLLIVEVADATLDFDLGPKALLYARSGLKELWVVDLPREAVHVGRGPSEHGYNSLSVLRAAAASAPRAGRCRPARRLALLRARLIRCRHGPDARIRRRTRNRCLSPCLARRPCLPSSCGAMPVHCWLKVSIHARLNDARAVFSDGQDIEAGGP